jgi:glycosyltransferase involved in cell wall biosynthesis
MPAAGQARVQQVAPRGADAPERRPLKLIIQIPCYNEEESLPLALADLPRSVPGVDVVEWLVINDGSRDRTVEVARAHGVDHIVDLPVNKGLAHAFMAGIQRALAEGADIIVNTDADNQYAASDIPALVAPILAREAEFVVGARPIPEIAHFSPTKRALQRLGSWVVRQASGTEVQDAPSGFRAITRDAALRLNIFDQYTYTLESIVQAGLSGMRIVSVPIGVNGETRPSRLVRSIPDYVRRSSISILRTAFIYKPGRTMFLMGLPLAMAGLLLAMRWLWLFLEGTDRAHVPSLVAAAGLGLTAIMLWIAGLIAELMGINRRLLQDVQYRLRKAEAERAEANGAAARAERG